MARKYGKSQNTDQPVSYRKQRRWDSMEEPFGSNVSNRTAGNMDVRSGFGPMTYGISHTLPYNKPSGI